MYSVAKVDEPTRSARKTVTRSEVFVISYTRENNYVAIAIGAHGIPVGITNDMTAKIHASARAPQTVCGWSGSVGSIHLSRTPHRFRLVPPYLVVIVIGGQCVSYFVKENVMEMMHFGL